MLHNLTRWIIHKLLKNFKCTNRISDVILFEIVVKARESTEFED